jgi:hypothetical protein
MTLTLAPNTEALVASWLREHPDIAALGASVAGEVPRAATAPWIRVTQLAAPARLEHLFATTLQLDCYAGTTAMTEHRGQMEAWQVKATTRAILLHEVKASTRDDVVVSDVRIVGDFRSPDTTTEPARERYILTVTVHAHPVPR